MVFQGKNSDLSVNENETVNILVELESTLIQLEISPETLSIKPGAGRQFSALGRFPNGDLDMTPHVSWRLEPQNAGAISSDGMFTTIGFVGGTETVFAHYGDISDSSFVHVLRPDDPFIRGQIRSENGTGISGVQLTFSNAGGIVETDNEGFYSNQVPLNWRGTVTPAKEGYTFEPESRTYQEIKEDQTDQDYTGIEDFAQISGHIRSESGLGLSGVQLTFSNSGGIVETDNLGFYSHKVPLNWSGTVTPAKEGYTFEPESRHYDSLNTDQADQDYTGIGDFVQISGHILAENGIGIPGVQLTFSNSGGTVETDNEGFYSHQVPLNWSGTVTPAREGYSFEPKSRTYQEIKEDQTDQDYIGTGDFVQISGHILSENGAGIPGVQLTFSNLDGTVETNNEGFYSHQVPLSWSGTVTPAREGYVFEPKSRTYQEIKENQSDQDYTGILDFVQISGYVLSESGTGIPGVQLTFSNSGGRVETDGEGYYSQQIPFNWSGTVTPAKEGYAFDPESIIYSTVTTNLMIEDYKGFGLPLLDEIVEILIEDGDENGSSGNGDGKIQIGETITLKINVKNNGFGMASNVNGVLRIHPIDASSCEILADQDVFPQIEDDGLEWNQAYYQLRAFGKPPGEDLDFNLVLSYDAPNALHFDTEVSFSLAVVPHEYLWSGEAIQDVYVNNAQPNSNNGESFSLIVGADQGERRHTLVNFDFLQVLPPEADIVKATLKLTTTGEGLVGAPFNVIIGWMREAWDENTVTWNQYGDMHRSYYFGQEYVIQESDQAHWQSDVTLEVTKMIENGYSYGFYVRCAEEEDKNQMIEFYSSESPENAGPTLEIIYSLESEALIGKKLSKEPEIIDEY